MFRTDLLSVIRSFNSVFTATGIFPTSYVDSLLARSGWFHPDLASQPTGFFLGTFVGNSYGSRGT